MYDQEKTLPRPQPPSNFILAANPPTMRDPSSLMNLSAGGKSRRSKQVRIAASLSLAVAAQLLLSADGPLSVFFDVFDSLTRRLSSTTTNTNTRNLQAISLIIDPDLNDEERDRLLDKYAASEMQSMEDSMMFQQTMFRVPTQEEHDVMYGDAGKPRLGGLTHNDRRSLSSDRIEEIDRIRDLRALSIDLGDGECEWTTPVHVTDTPENQIEKSWLAAFPGSGKRLTSFMVEALTGYLVGDDWDHSEHFADYKKVVMIKGQWPQREKFPWNWYRTTDDTILQLRNPRWGKL